MSDNSDAKEEGQLYVECILYIEAKLVLFKLESYKLQMLLLTSQLTKQFRICMKEKEHIKM